MEKSRRYNKYVIFEWSVLALAVIIGCLWIYLRFFYEESTTYYKTENEFMDTLLNMPARLPGSGRYDLTYDFLKAYPEPVNWKEFEKDLMAYNFSSLVFKEYYPHGKQFPTISSMLISTPDGLKRAARFYPTIEKEIITTIMLKYRPFLHYWVNIFIGCCMDGTVKYFFVRYDLYRL